MELIDVMMVVNVTLAIVLLFWYFGNKKKNKA